MEALRVGAIGVALRLTVADQDGTAIDVSTATLTNNLRIRRPDKSLLRKTPSFVTTGTDGLIYFDTIAGDLNVPGIYTMQFRLVISADDINSSVVTFVVEPNLYP
jgi:hypothetical protein